jgi:hypothetical protein
MLSALPDQRIAKGNVPEGMRNKALFALDLAALIAGARYRKRAEACCCVATRLTTCSCT